MATAREEFNAWWNNYGFPAMATRKQIAELAWHASARNTCRIITEAIPGATGQDSMATDGKQESTKEPTKQP